MSRTVRKDLDGTIVRDGKQYQAMNERSDPWDFPNPYNRSESQKLLRNEILQYIREGEKHTVDIIDYILLKHPFDDHNYLSWQVLEILDELAVDGLIQ